MREAQKRRPPQREWTDEELDLVRTLPAKEVIERTGRTRGAVYAKYHGLGLPDARFRSSRWNDTAGLWTPEQDELVRHLSPAEAAKLTGRSLGAVYSRRRGQHLQRLQPTTRPATSPGQMWTAEEDALVVALPPREVAERTGRSMNAVWARRHFLRHPERVKAGRRGIRVKRRGSQRYKNTPSTQRAN
jgi:predicted DNA-binding transcriptional regulator AlpA